MTNLLIITLCIIVGVGLLSLYHESQTILKGNLRHIYVAVLIAVLVVASIWIKVHDFSPENPLIMIIPLVFCSVRVGKHLYDKSKADIK
jgi:hypothetical protein